MSAGMPTAGGDLAARARALNEIILLKHGYSGDELTYDDVQNANLIRVVDRRKGLPVALGILYLHAARAQGWDSVGLAFPGHFLIRLSDGPERLIIDPFHGGRICDAASLRELLKAMAGQDVELTPRITRRCPDRDVLLRLQNNIKSRLLAGRPRRTGAAHRADDAAAGARSCRAVARGRGCSMRGSAICGPRSRRCRSSSCALRRAARGIRPPRCCNSSGRS